MALQSSGSISLQEIGDEANSTFSSTNAVSLNDASIRGLITKSAGASNSFNEYYGVSAEILLTSGGNVNGQAQRQEILASTFISSGGTLRIPSTMWIWSDDTSVAALTIDIPCTIINDGKIIGKGGQGGCGARKKNLPHPSVGNFETGYNTVDLGSGSDGGPAIKINSGVSGVTITNSSGAYIAGGGGGGGSSSVSPANSIAGGGGGAGGGEGGFKAGQGFLNPASNVGNGWPNYTTQGVQYNTFGHGGIQGTNNGNPPRIGFGGALNEKGHRFTTSLHSGGGYYVWSKDLRAEAGAAGLRSAGEDQVSSGGGGGGRILPGIRYTLSSNGSYGGAANEVGENGGAGGNTGEAGGGGVWGKAGGKGYRGTLTSVQCQGGDGGKAVEDSANSYTLNNSGTIYGATT